MSRRHSVGVALAALLAVGAAIGGYLLGAAEAPSSSEWHQERAASQRQAESSSRRAAFLSATIEGRAAGLKAGRRRGADRGAQAGARAGAEAAAEQLAQVEAERQAELTYDPQLPNGDPGYILPEEERSISCIAISEVTGECVGD